MLAKVLKERRKELGLTQNEIASKLNVTRQTISNWENGKSYPDVPSLISVSEVYKLSLDVLLSKNDDYITKVKHDYQLINKRKKARYLDLCMLVIVVLIIISAVISSFVHEEISEKIISILALLLTLALIPMSYIRTLSFYHDDSSNLFVPKVSGLGMTINPNHPIGKAFWIILFVGLVILLVHSVLII